MPFDLIKIILISLAGMINIFLGFLVLVRNPKNIINRTFFFTGFLYGIWAFCLLFYEFPVLFDSYFWIKATYIVISIQQIFVLAFSFIFPQPIFKKAWLYSVLYIIFFLCLTLYLILFTDYWIVDVVVDPVKGLQTILGDGYILWSLAIWVIVIWASVNFIYNLRSSTGKNKIQVLYLFGGFTLFGIVATIADIILPLVYKDTSLFAISTTASLIFTFTATYVIIKHRFLDIRFVVARSVTYTLLIVILGACYTTGLFVFTTYFIKEESSLSSLFISTVLALFAAFTFQPLKKQLEKITDAIFFKGNYDSGELLKNFSNIMSTTIELNKLSFSILETIVGEMRIADVLFVLLNKKNNIDFTASLGKLSVPDLKKINFDKFLEHKEIIIFDELEEEALKEIMRGLNIAVVLPMMIQNTGVGLLFLGQKASGDIYSDKDIDLLGILAPQLSVAIQNSKEYEQILKFNVTLRQEVNKATKDLLIANQKLEDLDKLKDDFVSVASHELRTPMTAIRSYAWMALHKSDIPLSQKLERYLYRTLVSTERLINLVNDMLNVSRIESGKIEINPKDFDIVALVKDVMEEVKAKADEKRLSVSIFEHALPRVFGDVDKVHQVLLNLIGNSLKFCYPGGSIIIDFFVSENFIEVTIKDNGAGVSRDDLPKLFHKFSRLDTQYTSVGTSGGTGLGLYISKNLIELMHGRIWAKSEGMDQGAAVTFTLPIATEELMENSQKYHIKPENGNIKPLEPVAI